MARISIQTTQTVTPMIYAYTTPEIARHTGWTKIGYTEQDVDKRLKQQTHTADVAYHEEWRGNAAYEGGGVFSDKDFHKYLKHLGVQQESGKNNEWFHISGPDSKAYFIDFRFNHGQIEMADDVLPYNLRAEQKAAVAKTKAYFDSHPKGEFLWNAKPRFGKTLAAYDFCRQIDAQTVLIVTNRPAIANSWYSDYVKFMGKPSGYQFVSNSDAMKDKTHVLSRDAYVKGLYKEVHKCIEFVSLQDLKGSLYFGGHYDKLREVAEMTWDVLIIDEAHEGVDTYKTDVAFDHIDRKFTLHLSGTPFKALANDKFEEDAIYNWTYADEQKAKRDWNEDDENPYATLPQLNLFTYQMSKIIEDELRQGMEIDGETEEYAFDLNEFFKMKNNGQFFYDDSVNRFLDALTTQSKFPFSTEALRDELKHTLWLLNRVESARALANKLKVHPVFKDYKIILAAGDGQFEDEKETAKSFDRVTEAIAKNEKSITLSVGQLTTGVTIPQWTAVLMLSNIKSPALYMQAAFRAQNPCLFPGDGQNFLRKENAYVFDFDPARTLTIFEDFANDLSPKTSDGRGSSDTREDNIRELLNFFPVIGEDENGEMIELDAGKVLTIPRKIRSLEVVRRGFMSDFLFQNISRIFNAPKEVMAIIQQLEPVKDTTAHADIPSDIKDQLSLNDDGDVELDDTYVIGKATEVFGDKIYDTLPETLNTTIDTLLSDPADTVDPLEDLKQVFHDSAIDPILETAKNNYAENLKASDQNRLKRGLDTQAESIVNKVYGDYSIKKNTLEMEYQKTLEKCRDDDSIHEANMAFNDQQKEILQAFQNHITDAAKNFAQSAAQEVVRTVETNAKEREKKSHEEKIRDYLRGFSRTIPSFLMAYGQEGITLDNFDTIIPGPVFKDVTSITLENFRLLRDGGPYTDEETGEEKHYDGHLFEPVIFNDSIKEFLNLKEKLANYFDESATEDIFDYIPPQKTNQIFTPKWVVKKMVDLLEEENPGCFDQPDKTFIDLFMKSGLYITEIVKRLYQSPEMKRLYPDSPERLNHIFSAQVYGLAPTEIIYRIATNYILGFDKDQTIPDHNFKLADSLEAAKAGKLEELLDKLYGDKK